MGELTAKQARKHTKNLRDHLGFAVEAMSRIVEDLDEDIRQKGDNAPEFECDLASEIENAEAAAIDAIWHLRRAEGAIRKLQDDEKITGGGA